MRDMLPSSASMRIAANEIRHNQRNRTLPAACVCVAALVLLAAFISWQNQAKINAQRAEYQQRVRSNWLEQPDRHPHRASHYGYLAFRPKSPLSFFDNGIDSFAGTSVFLEPHRQNTTNFSEARHSGGMLRFGELSPAMVLQLLAPLAIFFLGFATVTGERENATLPMLLAQGVAWRDLILGKLSGVAMMGLLIAAPGLLMIPAGIVSGDGMNRDMLLRAIAIVAGYAAYLLIFAAMAVLASARHQTSRGALTVLIMLWIVLCVVLPRGAQALGSAVAPAPSKAQFDAAIENDLARGGDSHNPDDPHFASLRAEMLETYGVRDVKDLPFNYGALVMIEAEKISSDIFRRHYTALLDAFRRQNRFSEWAAVINPYLAMRNLSMALAGSDPAHYADFQWQAESFRYDMVQRLNRLHLTEIRYENDRAQRVGQERWREFPAFEYRPQSVGAALRRQWLSAWALMVWLAALALMVRRISLNTTAILVLGGKRDNGTSEIRRKLRKHSTVP